MAKTECILIVVDPGADHHPAVERGMFLAEHLGMRVDLFICDYNAHLVGGLFLDSDKLKRAKAGYLNDKKKFLDKIAGPYKKRGIDVTTKVAWDRPLYEGIVRQALHSDARFVIKDTHYHSALSRVLIYQHRLAPDSQLSIAVVARSFRIMDFPAPGCSCGCRSVARTR